MADIKLSPTLPHLLTELAQDSSMNHYVQQLLQQKPLFIHFRSDLEQCFLVKRSQEFSQIFKIAAGLWLVLYLVILCGTTIFFPQLLTESHYLIWQGCLISTGFLIIVLNICAYLPHSHELIYHYLLAPSMTLLLYQLLIGALAYPDGEHNIYASYNIIICLIIITHTLRFLCLKSALIILCGTLMAGATVFVNHWFVPTLQVLHSFVLVIVVLLNIAFFVERRERLGFLHEVLVAIKSHELEQMNQHLATIAREDALSGVANRRAFDDYLTIEWERARREEQPLALLFIDIDHFKLYNDNYGHAAGDKCLQQVARTMHDALLRPADLVARYGGEEFVVLLPNTDSMGAEEVAHRILDAIDRLAIPHKRSLVTHHITVSIGICSMMPNEQNQLSALVANADAALYKAKAAGRHGYKHYFEPMSVKFKNS
ncbi:GGDEF domain-containing protein [Agitococcus lubricus]|uniref:diguanylate cyclase n=1 Tax=Agitococcus lubricus TaxID=1077255 RepID=A0A2T5IUL1_9GAMM|nr:diguanylate cyclase [Agitococcus lubricus]PTQ87550.1 diguanylate cyclase (GGDEF)-like protein [Agitococcus lubricus]